MIRRLLLLNGLAVIGSVINHTVGWGFTSLFWWTDRYEAVTVPNFEQLHGASYFGLRVLEQLVTFSLPAFLFVSGVFVAFAAGRGPTVPWSKVSGRVKMLLIPYALWSVAIFVGRILEGTTDTPTGYAGQLLFGRAAIPYYYIPLVTQLFLLSPLLVRWTRTRWKLVLVVAALVQAVVQVARYPVLLGWHQASPTWIWRHMPGWFFPHLVFWFVFGVFAGLHGQLFKTWLARWRPVLPWITVALGLAVILEWELLQQMSTRVWVPPTQTLLDSLYSGAYILSFLAFTEATIPASRQVDTLGERSFGVYLIHAPVLELLSRSVYHLAPIVLSYQLVFQSLLVAGGVGVPLLLMAMVKRSPVRPCYNYLFG